MYVCQCNRPHRRQRIVLTGGPGAGRTAVLELARQYFCKHVLVLPESAGILFGGGFPRGVLDFERESAQRVIYRIQRELEEMADHREDIAVVLCDRGTVDGAAYWPAGPQAFWAALGTTAEAELSRYDAVIHLQTPAPSTYNHSNPLRIESALEASAIDARIAQSWERHPLRETIESTPNFLEKAARAVSQLQRVIPECCRPASGSADP